MAGGDYESGYWVVHAESFDAPTQVEHASTFEQARSRWEALGGSAAFSAEVYGADGAVLLHQRMERFDMMAPRVPGQYDFDMDAGMFKRVGR